MYFELKNGRTVVFWNWGSIRFYTVRTQSKIGTTSCTNLINLKQLFVFISNRPGYYISNAYFLIFLITISGLTIFSVDCTLPQNRLQTTYTILLTSVSFKWVINRSLPTVSYLTSLDKYAITSIFYLILVSKFLKIFLKFYFLFKNFHF